MRLCHHFAINEPALSRIWHTLLRIILHHPCPSIAYNTIHHSLCIILYPCSIHRHARSTDTLPTSMFYYYHILHVWAHTHTIRPLSMYCTFVHPSYRCITFDPSYSFDPSYIVLCCCRYGRIIAPSHIRFVSMVLIHPFICLSSIIFLSSIHQSIINTQIASSFNVFVSYHR